MKNHKLSRGVLFVAAVLASWMVFRMAEAMVCTDIVPGCAPEFTSTNTYTCFVNGEGCCQFAWYTVDCQPGWFRVHVQHQGWYCEENGKCKP
jgi:hypothetical protein